uniref:histidine kinase n=1 Tax=Solibacter usitatus (strain Ellin6076) TaxID=234267 RepID=Q01PT1_SOLUE
MTLQAKLTLGSVLLATLIVSFISAVDLGNLMQLEFQGVYERADLVKDLSKDAVIDTLNRPRDVNLREALGDPELRQKLLNLLSSSKAIFSIDLVSVENNEIMASTLKSRVGSIAYPTPPDFAPLVKEKGWVEKMKVLFSQEPQYYMLQEPLGSGDVTIFFVRVIIHPAFLREPLTETFLRHAKVAGLSIVLAVFLTFLFSMVAFRKLGRIGQMLDLAARGEFEPAPPDSKTATDELSVMASKVTLLGQRLRGAQFEVSDLRGNIDHLLQDLEDGVFVFNREFRLVFASGSVEKFLGRDRSDLPGQLLADVFPPSTMLGLLIAQASQTGRPLHHRRVPVTPAGDGASGATVVLLSVDNLESVPGGPSGGSGILVRLRDPEAQRKINRELQTADRLSAISRISSGVAHEVKNPLNAILLHVEVARGKLSHGNTDVAPQMEIIAREILRLDRVVRTFLDFTRPVELKLATVSMRELVQEIVELARPQAAAAGIGVTVRDEAEGVDVRVDRDLFKQAVLNIVVNGMQAMPEGGELRFEATAGENGTELRISDTGTGIPEALREKIFRLYFSTKKEGSGIGLAMTFRIVQLHDGTIDFTSEPGKGTTFLIRLPIAV